MSIKSESKSKITLTIQARNLHLEPESTISISVYSPQTQSQQELPNRILSLRKQPQLVDLSLNPLHLRGSPANQPKTPELTRSLLKILHKHLRQAPHNSLNQLLPKRLPVRVHPDPLNRVQKHTRKSEPASPSAQRGQKRLFRQVRPLPTFVQAGKRALGADLQE